MTTTSILACGNCLDRQLCEAVPFLFYWCILLGIWMLGAGFPLAILSLARKEPLPLNPIRFFLGTLGCIALAVVPSAGSLVLPASAVAAYAVYRTVLLLVWERRLRPQPPTLSDLWLYRVQRIFLAVAVLAIPVAYVRMWLQR